MRQNNTIYHRFFILRLIRQVLIIYVIFYFVLKPVSANILADLENEIELCEGALSEKEVPDEIDEDNESKFINSATYCFVISSQKLNYLMKRSTNYQSEFKRVPIPPPERAIT